jgi:hypothetical protein
MAQQRLDQTNNEQQGRAFAKINENFDELYAGTGLETFTLGSGTKTAAATAGAATLNKAAGTITSEALTTAAGSAYTLTITNSAIAAADQVMASVSNGTNTQGQLVVETVTPAAGSVVIVVRNRHSSEALNGTIKIAFVAIK